MYRAGLRRERAKTKTAPRSCRFGQEAVEAEGYRPRPYGFDPFAALAPWRHGPRTAAPRLCLQAARKDAAGRAALGAVGEAA